MLKKMLVADAEGPDQLEKVFNQMLQEEKDVDKAAAETEKQTPAAPREAAGPRPEKSAKASSSAKSPPSDAGADASFQDTIRRTMERMQMSGEQATAAAASEGGEDFMSEMLKQLSEGTVGAEGSDDDFSKMLMGMMEQLTNKDILFEPMKELHDKFPGWFDKNKGSTSAGDLKRYEEQQMLVGEIVAKFEQNTYSDANVADREYIVERMQKVSRRRGPRAGRLLASTDTRCFRCKRLGRRRPTWWGTWRRRRRPLTPPTSNAIHSRSGPLWSGHHVFENIPGPSVSWTFFASLPTLHEPTCTRTCRCPER